MKCETCGGTGRVYLMRPINQPTYYDCQVCAGTGRGKEMSAEKQIEDALRRESSFAHTNEGLGRLCQEAAAAISSQAAEIERLTAEIESHKTTRRMWQDQCAGWAVKASEWAAEKDALTAELSHIRTVLGAAEKALIPLSTAADNIDRRYKNLADGQPTSGMSSEYGFTVGDFRAARSALAAIRPAQEPRAEEKE